MTQIQAVGDFIRLPDMPPGLSIPLSPEPGIEAVAWALSSAEVIGGPECVETIAWWQVEDANGVQGWTPEVSDESGSYFFGTGFSPHRSWLQSLS